MKNALFIFSIFVSTCNLMAQWNKLPTPTSPNFSPTTVPGPSTKIISPNLILPIGNGKIIYTVEYFASPSSGGFTNLYVSKSDLNTNNCLICINSPIYACCKMYGFSSLNDSVFSFIHNSGGGCSTLYTYDNWKNQRNSECPMMLSEIKQTAITKNNIYAITYFANHS